MVFAVYSYARKFIKDRTTIETEHTVEESHSREIPISMAESELQFRTINTINCLSKQIDEIKSGFQDLAEKLDIQFKNIAHKIDIIEQKN